ncbi:MAG TPA: PIN domain-containing protein [Candidatus Acidoferrales bacterium]|jgi:predicted nucleic acid-binding protein|nr:PIN domain-containing protein [Candidatus Acidoferrales bacterium]
MTLVDTSVWIDHFEHVDTRLADLLANRAAGLHPFVIGEVAAGSIKHRATTLGDLALLPQAPIAKEGEVHHLLEAHRLWSTGLGWVDLHLLTAALLMGWKLLTSDRAMKSAAQKLGIAHREN